MEAIEAAGVPRATKRSGWPLLLAVLAGVAGSLGAVAAFGEATHTIAPFRVRLSVTPIEWGSTTLTLAADGLPETGTANATTHRSPISFGARIVGIDPGGSVDLLSRADPVKLTEPESVARFLAENGKGEARAFGIRVALIALGGGFAAAIVAGLGSWKRGLAGAVAGIVVLGVFALAAQQTYDVSGFRGSSFTRAASE